MTSWTRVYWKEPIKFGCRSLGFTNSSTGEPYVVEVDDAEQNEIFIQGPSWRCSFDLQVFAINEEGKYRLSGRVNDRAGRLTEDGKWLELTLSAPAQIEIAGNAVLIRVDRETGEPREQVEVQ